MLLPGRPPAFILGHSIGNVALLPFLSFLICKALTCCRRDVSVASLNLHAG